MSVDRIFSILCLCLAIALYVLIGGSSVLFAFLFYFVLCVFSPYLIWPLLDAWIFLGRILMGTIGKVFPAVLFYCIFCPYVSVLKIFRIAKLERGFIRSADDNDYKRMY